MSVFRFSRWDALCVATVPAHVSFYLFLAIYYEAVPLAVLVTLPLIALGLNLQNAGANHNHYHTPVFRKRWANNLLTIGYAIAGGRPRTPFNVGHGFHHQEAGTYNQFRVRDVLGWSRPAAIVKSVALQYLNALCLEYLVYWWILERTPVKEVERKFPRFAQVMVALKRRPALIRQTELEIVAVITWNILLCSINYRFFLLCYLPAQFFVSYVRMLDNFVQHYGATDPADPARDSVSCYGRLYNWLTFNLGYHQEHHLRSGVHWLRLPELTAELPSDRRVVPFIHYINLPILFPLPKSPPRQATRT